MEAGREPGELIHWLRDLFPELDSPLSGYVALQRENEDNSDTEETPLAAEPPLLLPARVSSIKKFLKGRNEATVSWVLTLVEVLNYHAVMGRSVRGPKTLTAAQELMVTRLYGAVERFMEKGGTLSKFADYKQAIGQAKFDYSGEPVQYMEELSAAKIIPCWPKPGEAAIQDAVDFVPDEVKMIGGEEKSLQRFISILVPSNTYQAHMVADDAHLPYLGQMAMLEVDEDEEMLVDSEDLVSCFNLFRLPRKWAGFCTFAKKVRSSIFGGPPDEMSYVGLRVVPMGWINSVSLMQTVVRRLVFGLSRIPATSEVSKLKWFPEDDSISVVYLDSYDEVRRVKAEYREVLDSHSSARHNQFVETCKELDLPLNQGKRLVGAVRGTLQGGDIDGEAGTFEASYDKKLNLMGLAAALLGAGRATEFELRHFVGKAIFAMAFRRPSMSFLEEIFVDIGKAQKGPVSLSRRTMDEIYTVMVMLPVLVMNLRAQFDPEVTITDA
eukprot:s905_g21.t1